MLRTGKEGGWMQCWSVVTAGEDCIEDIDAPGGHNTGLDDNIAGYRHRADNIP